jgi:hypothetical protein
MYLFDLYAVSSVVLAGRVEPCRRVPRRTTRNPTVDATRPTRSEVEVQVAFSVLRYNYVPVIVRIMAASVAPSRCVAIAETVAK